MYPLFFFGCNFANASTDKTIEVSVLKEMEHLYKCTSLILHLENRHFALFLVFIYGGLKC